MKFLNIATVVGATSVAHLREAADSLQLDMVFDKTVSHNNFNQTLFMFKGQGDSFKTIDGQNVYVIAPDAQFNVEYTNRHEGVKEIIHAHGMIAGGYDGVPYISGLPLEYLDTQRYTYPVLEENRRSGEYWLHSHWHIVDGMTIPIIIENDKKYPSNFPKEVADNLNDAQESQFFIEDFCPYLSDDGPGSNPTCCNEIVMKGLQEMYYGQKVKPTYPSFEEPATNENNCDVEHVDPADSGDVGFEALLVNGKDATAPQTVKVNSRFLRVRLTNAAAQSNFKITFGGLPATLVAVDGQWVEPVDITESGWWAAVAQRLTVLIDTKDMKDDTVFIARNEATGVDSMQGGVVVTKADAPATRSFSLIGEEVGYMTNENEKKLHAIQPLSVKEPDVEFRLNVTGDNGFQSLNGWQWFPPNAMHDTPFVPNPNPMRVHYNDRVEITIFNNNPDGHPIHLHQHTFQVVAVNGERLENGALRDTIYVEGGCQSVTIAFDAVNPASTALLHCHLGFHQEAGMFSTVQYVAEEKSL